MRALVAEPITFLPDGNALRQDRKRARLDAACAIKFAAQSLSLDSAALSASAYRAFRASRAELRLPSSLAISVLFAGWQRAREQALALVDDTVVEAQVVQALYGDPSRRHLQYATAAHPAQSVAGALEDGNR